MGARGFLGFPLAAREYDPPSHKDLLEGNHPQQAIVMPPVSVRPVVRVPASSCGPLIKRRSAGFGRGLEELLGFFLVPAGGGVLPFVAEVVFVWFLSTPGTSSYRVVPT